MKKEAYINYVQSQIKCLTDTRKDLAEGYEKLFERLKAFEEKLNSTDVILTELQSILANHEVDSRKKKD